MSTPHDIARAEGYTDQEIKDFLSKRSGQQQSTSKFHEDKYKEALAAGYTKQEIDKHLLSKKPAAVRGARKAGRIGMQVGLGAAERALMPYELAVAPLASKEAQQVPYRENVAQDIERLLELKSIGAFDEEDQKLLESLQDQLAHPEKSEEFIKTADLGVRGLVQKATGIDTHPEGALEKAANWVGFIKKPSNAIQLAKSGLSTKELTKAILPTGTETLRGLGAGTALQMAEEGDAGPIGTIAASIVGDLIGGGAAGVIKSLKNPKQSLAQATAFFTPKSKLATQSELIQKAREAEVPLDVGTITGSNVLKTIQAKLAASGLVGQPLEKLRSQMTTNVIDEYKKVIDAGKQVKFESLHDAGEAFQNLAKKSRKASQEEYSKIYEKYESLISPADATNPTPILARMQDIENKLKPGSFKSSPQRNVLDIIEMAKQDLVDVTGAARPAKIQDLINLKKAISQEISYDTQGGLDKLLKPIVEELDKTILAYGASGKGHGKLLAEANKKASEHIKTFREGTVGKFLKKDQNPDKILNQMSSIRGIREIKQSLLGTTEGRELWDQLRFAKLDQVIGDKMIDSTTKQLKTGKFSNLLEKKTDRAIVRELIGKEAYQKLDRLQNVTGRLAETAQKFLNTSQTATAATDATILTGVLYGLGNLLLGNPYPFAKIGAGLTGAYLTSRLFADPKFLTMVEEAVLARNNPATFAPKMQKLAEYLKSKGVTSQAAGFSALESSSQEQE